MGISTFRRGRSQSERLRRNSRGLGGELEGVFTCVGQGSSVKVTFPLWEPGLPWLY